MCPDSGFKKKSHRKKVSVREEVRGPRKENQPLPPCVWDSEVAALGKPQRKQTRSAMGLVLGVGCVLFGPIPRMVSDSLGFALRVQQGCAGDIADAISDIPPPAHPCPTYPCPQPGEPCRGGCPEGNVITKV